MKKKILTFLASLLICSGIHSQAPGAVNYQAVVRDGAGAIVANQNVGIQLSVLQGSATGTAVYQETFTPTTNTFGLINMQIGTGAVQTGAFNTIDWGIGPYFIETAVDVTGGTNYVTISTTQFMSVPYALHAKTVDTTYLNNVINSVSTDDQDLTGATLTGTSLQIDIESGSSTTVDLSSLTDADADSTNELQALSLSNDTLYLSNGNSVSLNSTNAMNESVGIINVPNDFFGADSTQVIYESGSAWWCCGPSYTVPIGKLWKVVRYTGSTSSLIADEDGLRWLNEGQTLTWKGNGSNGSNLSFSFMVWEYSKSQLSFDVKNYSGTGYWNNNPPGNQVSWSVPAGKMWKVKYTTGACQTSFGTGEKWLNEGQVISFTGNGSNGSTLPFSFMVFEYNKY